MDINKISELAATYFEKGDLQQSEHLFKEILSFQPDNSIVLHYLGVIRYQLQDFDRAIEYLTKALGIESTDPLNFFSHNIMGDCFHKQGKTDEAIMHYQRALEINPASAEVCYSLGNIFRDKQCFDDAIFYYRKAIEIEPGNSLVYNNLAILLKDTGALNAAEDCLRKAIEKDPSCFVYYSNLLFLRNCNSKYDAQGILNEHLQFGEIFAEPLSSSIVRQGSRHVKNNRLRIGYVSPDFKFHSVAFFIEPILAEHNREHFEIFCYSDWPFPDKVTKRIQEHVRQWRNIAGMADKDVYNLIRKDEIDILVDLAGHASSIRILLFARKPAPVQVSWIGYPATTGLSTMDYKIVDNYTDPQGMTDQYYTEKLIRMPESFLCYLPDKDSPAVGDLPALLSGRITFGSFNNLAKVSPEVIETWTKILKSIPGCCLIMKAKSLSDRSTRDYVMGLFTQRGIESERIELLSWKQSVRGHLDIYNRIDIGLDTFPYNGTTTTCEAIWMGVPVIALAGNTHASRVGVSLLSNAGIPELIAKTYEEYIEIAINLAADIERLKALRGNLRSMMANSSLTDAKRFVVNLENSYRTMWEDWCRL